MELLHAKEVARPHPIMTTLIEDSPPPVHLSLQIPTIEKNVNMTDIETSAEFSDHYTSVEDDF